MSCAPFKSSEANAKAFLKTKGVLDKYLNIIDLGGFRKFHRKLVEQAKSKYFPDNPDRVKALFYEENNGTKAIPDKQIFKEIDIKNGVKPQDEYAPMLVPISDRNKSQIIKVIEKEKSFIKELGPEQTYLLAQHFVGRYVSEKFDEYNEDTFNEKMKEYLKLMQNKINTINTVFNNPEIKAKYNESQIATLEDKRKKLEEVVKNWDIVTTTIKSILDSTKGVKVVLEESSGEDNRGDVYNLENYEIDPKLKASTELKMFLSSIKVIGSSAINKGKKLFVEKYNTEESKVDFDSLKAESYIRLVPESEMYQRNWFGEEMYVPFSEVYKTIMAELAGIPENTISVISKLRKSKVLWMPQVVNKLEANTTPKKIVNEFVSKMPKKALDMRYIQLVKQTRTVKIDGKEVILTFYKTYVRKTNTSETASLIMKDWENNFKQSEYLIPDGEGDYFLNKKYIEEKYEAFYETLNDSDDKELIAEELKTFGIIVTPETYNSIDAKSMKAVIKGLHNSMYNFLENFPEGKYNENTIRPLAITDVKQLAANEARYNSIKYLSPDNFRTQSKQIYSYTTKDFLTDRLLDLKNNYGDVIDNLSDSPFSQDSEILRLIKEKSALLSDFDSIEDFDLQTIKDLELFTTYGDQRFTRINEIDQELATLAYYVNSNTQFSSRMENKRVARYVFPTFSDKTRGAIIPLVARKVQLNKDNSLSKEAVDELYNRTVLPELKRIASYYELNGENSNHKEYSFAGKFFYFFPELNNVMITTKSGQPMLVSNAIKYYIKNFDKSASNIKPGIPLGDLEIQLKAKLKELVEKQIENKYKSWEESEIIPSQESLASGDNTKDFLLDINYLERMIRNKNPELGQISIEQYLQGAYEFAAEFKVNDIIAKAEMFYVFLGDPANMAKKSKDFNKVLESLESNTIMDLSAFMEETRTNIGKRLALAIAPREKIAESYFDEYIQIMLEDPRRDSLTLEYLSNILDNKKFDMDKYNRLDKDGKKKYLENFPKTKDFIGMESTDAQEYVTLEEYMETLRLHGDVDITKEEVNRVLELDKQDTLTPAERAEYEYYIKKGLLAPQKPVYTGQVYDEQYKNYRILYIKSSSIPLAKHFTQGYEIDKLRQFAETFSKQEDKTVRISYSTANKLGSVTKPYNIFNDDGSIKEPMSMLETINNIDDSNKPYLVLPRSNFGFQQEIPEKEASYVKSASQERKLLFLDLLDNPEMIKLNDRFINLYEEIYGTQREQLLREILNKDGSLNIRELSRILKEQARTKSLQDVKGLEVDEAGEFVLPLWLHPSSDTYENLINSLINNRILKILFPGKSYVLASPEGFTEIRGLAEGETIPNNTIFTSGWDGKLTNSHFIDKRTGKIIDKAIEKYNPDDIEFVPAKVLVSSKIVVDGKTINIKDYTYEKDGKLFLDETRIDKKILKLFGFRIPTSGMMSMASMEIAGFLPEETRSLIIAPADFLKQMGSDFDVDKLFTYSYELKKSSEGKIEVKNNSVINEILDIHHEVLSAKSTYIQSQILAPLSFDVAREQADLIDAKRVSSGEKLTSILDDEYQKYKRIGGAASKSGTGTYSLAITGHASFQQIFARNLPFFLNEVEYKDSKPRYFKFKLRIAGLNFDGNFGKIKTLDGRRNISHILSQRQNYALDNEKEQLMYRLNDNKFTFDYNVFMDSAGFDLIDVREGDKIVTISITDFIRTSPVVEKFVSLRNNGMSETDAIEAINYKFNVNYNDNFLTNVGDPSFAQKVYDGTANPSDVFRLFLYASEKGKMIKNVYSNFNTDSKGLEIGFANNVAKKVSIYNLLKSKFYGNLGAFNKYTINGLATDFGLQTTGIFYNLYPYQSKTFYGILENVLGMLQEGNPDKIELSGEEIKEVFDEFKKFLFSSKMVQKVLPTSNISELREELFFTVVDETGTIIKDSLASYVSKLKRDGILKESMFNLIETKVERGRIPSTLEWNNNVKFDNDDKFYYEFLNMFTSTTPLEGYDFNGEVMTKQRLAQYLVAYGYVEGGIQGASQFMKYVPLEYILNFDIVKSISKINLDDLSRAEIDSFITQFIQHNPRFLPTTFNSKTILKSDEIVSPNIDKNSTNINELTSFYYVPASKILPDYIRVNNYKPNVANEKTKKKAKTLLFKKIDGSGFYVRIPVLGIHGMSEYNFDLSGVLKSKIDDYNKATVFNTVKVNPLQSIKDKLPYNLDKDNLNLNDILLSIVENSSFSYNRIFAEYLASKNILGLEIKFDNTLDDSVAGYYKNGKIVLNSKVLSQYQKDNNYGKIETLILHEVLHAFTVDKLISLDSVAPQVKYYADKLNTMRQYIIDNVLSSEEKAALESVKKKIEILRKDNSAKVDISELESEMESFVNLSEFVAASTSKQFRDKLKTVKYKDTNLLSRIKRFLKKLVSLLLQSEGLDTNEFSVEYFDNLINLVDYSIESGLPSNFTQGNSIEEEFTPSRKQVELVSNVSKVNKDNFYKLSKSLQNFINNLYDINFDENKINNSFKQLNDEEKKFLAKSIGRTYKNIDDFNWDGNLNDDVSLENLFYYIQTGNTLDSDVNEEYKKDSLIKEYGKFVLENKKFVEDFDSLPENIKKQQQKDYNKIREKNDWYINQFSDIKYNIRKKLLEDLGYEWDESGFNRNVYDKGGKTTSTLTVEKNNPNPELANQVYEGIETLKKQNLFTVKPIQAADKKATIKASVATQYIGFGEGITNSSTELYRQQVNEEYNKAVKEANSRPANTNIPQNLQSGVEKYGTLQYAIEEAQKTLGKNVTSIEMIENGFRTRTTRTDKELEKYNIKVGSYVKMFGNDQFGNIKNVIVKITKITKGYDDANWYKEGWTQEGLQKLKDHTNTANAVEFQVIKPANSGSYNTNDVIFVSIGGKRGTIQQRKEQQDKTIKEALKAIEAGATLITDNKSYIEKSDYNEGEKRLYKNLEVKGYKYSEQNVDGQVLGVWNKPAKTTTEIKQGVSELFESNPELANPNPITNLSEKLIETKPVFEVYSGNYYKFTLNQNRVVVEGFYSQGNMYSWKPMNTKTATKKYIDITSNPEKYQIVKEKKADTSPEVKTEETKLSSSNFKFSDGTVIDVPFKLNAQQEAALLELEKFVKDPESFNNQITLLGYAGTGKTTIIGLFDRYLKKSLRYITPKYSSPTHRANAVTKLNNPKANVMTLHKMFGLSGKLDIEKGDYTLQDLKFAARNKAKLQSGDFIIIDEASMTNDELFDFIEEYKVKNNIKVIYVGDPAQLSPVGKKNDELSKVFSSGKQIQLTIVERTGDNPILEESTNLRNNLPLSYETKMKKGYGVEYVNDSTRQNKIMFDEVKSMMDSGNLLQFRILSAKNANLPGINKDVRNFLFGEEAENQVVVGDLLMGYDNFDVNYSTGEPLIYNSGDYQVSSVQKDTKEINIDGKLLVFNGYDVVLKNVFDSKDSVKKVFIVDNSESDDKIQQFVNKVAQLNIEAEKLYKSGDRKGGAEKYTEASNLKSKLAFMKSIFDTKGNLKIKSTFEYGYAHTIHKSQGGTYDKVFVLGDTITNSKFSTKNRQQLMYVAMSRARYNVYWSTLETKIPNQLLQTFGEEDLFDFSPEDLKNQDVNNSEYIQSFMVISNRNLPEITLDLQKQSKCL